MYMCVRDIEFAYFYDFSIEFLELFRHCDNFFSFYYCGKRIMMMHQQQGLQKKYCKAEQYFFGAWWQAETSLKIVDLSWKYQKYNEQIKIKRQWLSPWGTSEIHGPFLGSPGPVPMHRSQGPTLYHTRFCKSSSLSFYRYNIMCFVKHASSKRYC